MLLFQIQDKEHPLDRFKERIQHAAFDLKWLVQIVAEINSYLPDDWRMTRSSNNFLIQIVGGSSVVLTGSCYRLTDGRIINIIDTIFQKGMFDKYDLSESAGLDKKAVTARFKKVHPEIIVPNLYYFQPCPDDAPSPLFARQYEKIKIDAKGTPAGDQYHRLHPLTKAGLDLIHFRWVRWTINGDVQEVDAPPPDYHGKDYWSVPLLQEETKRCKNVSVYEKSFDNVLKAFDIRPPKPAEKVDSPYETEYKYMIQGDQQVAEGNFKSVKKALGEWGFKARPEEVKEQKDIYFDDENISLHNAGASFRLRQKKDNIRVTLKKRMPALTKYSEKGFYTRIEEEIVISPQQKDELMKGRPVNVLPYTLLNYIVPGHQALKPVLIVHNKRRLLIIEDAEQRKAELCFDTVYYEISGKRPGPFLELEIESKGMPRDVLGEFAKHIEEDFGFLPSLQSKYERGVTLLKMAKNPPVKKMVIIDTDCGVDDALGLILALKTRTIDLKAVTTVAGNVDVHNVTQNVFKVFNAMNITAPPPVAKGAQKPMMRELKNAESVHGTDGLGDMIQAPRNCTVDKRPAWELICKLAREFPKQITLVTLGPLTNLALAIQKDPEGVRCLKEVVAMGGVFFEVGNIGPDAEFNVTTDPEAAHKVVEFCRNACRKIPVDKYGNEVKLPAIPLPSNYDVIVAYKDKISDDKDAVPLTFIGLDVTHKVLLRRIALERAVKSHPTNDLLKFTADISRKYMGFYEQNEGLPGCYLHDPLAVAYVINPAFLEVEKHIICVETAGRFTSGVIFPDDRPTRNKAWRNPADEVIGIARKVEREAFEEFFMSKLVEA